MAGKPVRNRVGAFSSRTARLRVDGRTSEAKLMAETDEALIDQYGGREKCSAARIFLIEDTSMLRMMVAGLRTRMAEGGDLPDTTIKRASAISGALRSNLVVLGLDRGDGEPEVTLADYVRMKLAAE